FLISFDGSCASTVRRNMKIARWFGENNLTDLEIESNVNKIIGTFKSNRRYKIIKSLVPTAMGVCGAYFTFMAISLFGQMRREAQTAAYIQRRLSSINALFRALASINSLPAVQTVSELRMQSERYSETTEMELEELARRLDKNKFVPPADGGIPVTFKTFFAGKGDVANALLEAKKVMAKASDGMILIGHLDAYLSVAKLLRERKNSHAPYCFVEILENQSTPVINATDFHHPVVNEKVVVTNSIAIGNNNNPRSIMISGVNAGGKSTHMKAVALCCIFGQVFGVAPARSFSFTPFHTINTHLNITDDVSKQQSLFRAEITRAQELLDTVNALPSNQFSVTILDEICTGTEYLEGQALAHAIAKKLGMYPNSVLLLASHFPGLTTLAKDRKDLYKNMKVVVEKDENGEFVYPYGLYEGSTTQQIAPDLLEKVGLPLVMTQKMRDVLNHPDRYVPTKE
ncbi:MAG: mismatch repair protein MutS, partial [Candidatus Dependentiae bacterium]|nr:mismatch repair protein MutS [Candidatus Dependentiae bacterium]